MLLMHDLLLFLKFIWLSLCMIIFFSSSIALILSLPCTSPDASIKIFAIFSTSFECLLSDLFTSFIAPVMSAYFFLCKYIFSPSHELLWRKFLFVAWGATEYPFPERRVMRANLGDYLFADNMFTREFMACLTTRRRLFTLAACWLATRTIHPLERCW